MSRAIFKTAIVYVLLTVAIISLFANPEAGDPLYYQKMAAMKLVCAASGYGLVYCLRRGW